MEPLVKIVALNHEAAIPGMVTHAILSGMIAESLGKVCALWSNLGESYPYRALACHGSTDLLSFTRQMYEDNFLLMIPGPFHSYLLEVLVLLIQFFT